jgi:hypothetical protein
MSNAQHPLTGAVVRMTLAGHNPPVIAAALGIPYRTVVHIRCAQRRAGNLPQVKRFGNIDRYLHVTPQGRLSLKLILSGIDDATARDFLNAVRGGKTANDVLREAVNLAHGAAHVVEVRGSVNG